MKLLRGGAILTFLLALGLPQASARAAEIVRSRQLMGTLGTVSAEDPDSAAAALAVERALDEIQRLEKVMSSWRPDSELRILNRSGGGACSAELFAAIDSSLALAAMTEGAFDPTVDPLIEAWDLRGSGRVPSRTALWAARARVGWSRVELDRPARSVRLAPGTTLDLGGIGKGFALDRAAVLLREAGVERAMLNLGGELLVSGRHEIAVAHPADRLRPAISLRVEDAAVSTSGQSERGFEVRGRRFGHVLDPRTGRPVEGRASVTVICASSTRADALATALLVLGRDRAALWCARHPEVGALWLEPRGDGVRAWIWNVTSAAPLDGVRVTWMSSPAPTGRRGISRKEPS